MWLQPWSSSESGGTGMRPGKLAVAWCSWKVIAKSKSELCWAGLDERSKVAFSSRKSSFEGLGTWFTHLLLLVCRSTNGWRMSSVSDTGSLWKRCSVSRCFRMVSVSYRTCVGSHKVQIYLRGLFGISVYNTLGRDGGRWMVLFYGCAYKQVHVNLLQSCGEPINLLCTAVCALCSSPMCILCRCGGKKYKTDSCDAVWHLSLLLNWWSVVGVMSVNLKLLSEQAVMLWFKYKEDVVNPGVLQVQEKGDIT